MIRRFLPTVGMLAALLVTACAHLTPAPSFVQELNSQYQTLSTYEGEPFYDWTDAAYFHTKGKRALKGYDVQPEDPETWRVPVEYKPELNNAYDILQIALVPDRKKVTSPIAAAQAQAYFDCWVEQAQEKWPQANSASCKAKFYDAVCRMYGGGSCKGKPMDKIYRVFFETNKTTLDLKSQQTLNEAVAAYKKGAKEVLIAGHADRVGNAAANLNLSNRRSHAVAKALEAKGVPARVINLKAFGEGQPLVSTPDDVPNQSNRRALIVVR